MRKSQAGVSDVIILIAVTISVVMCCTGYYMYQVAERNRHTKKALEDSLQAIAAKLSKLGKAAHDIAVTAGTKQDTPLPSTKVFEDLLAKQKEDLKLAGADQTLEDSLLPLENRVHVAEVRLSVAKSHREMAKANKDETVSRLAKIETALNQEVTRLGGRFDALSNQLSEEGNGFAGRIDALNAEVTKFKEELVNKTRKNQDEVMRTRNEISRLEQELAKLQQREALVRDITRVAGKVVFADRRTTYAYVDLGAEHGVKEGMKFLVIRIDKGGARHDKGEVEVKHVFSNQSQVSITGVRDAADPIIEGDLVENPLYDPKRAKVVVLLGSFPQRDYRWTLDEIKARIRRAGAKLEDQVTIHTDYVITGAELTEEDPVYKQSALLSVPLVPLTRLLPYLGD